MIDTWIENTTGFIPFFNPSTEKVLVMFASGTIGSGEPETYNWNIDNKFGVKKYMVTLKHKE